MPQSYVSLPIHVGFSTKNREPFIREDWEPRLYEYVGGIVRNEKCLLLAAGGVPDHAHLLISLSKEKAIADVLRVVKTNSSRWIHDVIPACASFAWQPGYGAFAVSQSNIEKVRKYIANQKEHHRTMTFKDEYVALLKRHGIPYDERYLWTADADE